MDWIERWLHFSPDGGNGYVEWVIVLFIAFLVAAAVWRRVRRARSRVSHVTARQADR